MPPPPPLCTHTLLQTHRNTHTHSQDFKSIFQPVNVQGGSAYHVRMSIFMYHWTNISYIQILITKTWFCFIWNVKDPHTWLPQISRLMKMHLLIRQLRKKPACLAPEHHLSPTWQVFESLQIGLLTQTKIKNWKPRWNNTFFPLPPHQAPTHESETNCGNINKQLRIELIDILR